MPARPPVQPDRRALTRRLDRSAHGHLRADTPNYWNENVHALSSLAFARVLEPSVFDALAEVNKTIIIARVARLLEVLRSEYLRRTPPPSTKAWHLHRRSAIYVGSQQLWDRIERLAEAPGVDGGTATHEAARQLADLLDAARAAGELVFGDELEACLERGRAFVTDSRTAASLIPILDASNLDADDVHAYLCAFDTAFPRHDRWPKWRTMLARMGWQ
jgi:hypothetical protein